ncbi:MAG: hypothetical protein KA319_11210, partial [Ferruginibacter sp.]|nr:hypothetical protein [Ferruginibacter sp.]
MKQKIILIALCVINLNLKAQKHPPSLPYKKHTNIQQIPKWMLSKANYSIVSQNAIQFGIFEIPGIPSNEIRGMVILSNYDGNLQEPLLKAVGQKLADDKYIVCIINHQVNQDWVDETKWNNDCQKMEDAYKVVYYAQKTRHNITLNKVAIGGVSFSGFTLQSKINSGNSFFASCRGLVLIASGTNANIAIPVVNIVCENDIESNSYGNIAGNMLMSQLNQNNTVIAAKSSCITSSECSGHNTV